MIRPLLLLGLLAACASVAGPDATPGAATAPALAADAAQQAPRAAVASVVILEKKECCACTDRRQKDSRAAFDAEVAKRTVKPPVTVIYMDTELDRARLYLDMQTPVVTPAYYFLDAAGKMATFLQGEITADQLAGVLGTP